MAQPHNGCLHLGKWITLSLKVHICCRVVKPAEGVFVSVKKPPPMKTWKVLFVLLYETNFDFGR